jgi:hypothetical protein
LVNLHHTLLLHPILIGRTIFNLHKVRSALLVLLCLFFFILPNITYSFRSSHWWSQCTRPFSSFTLTCCSSCSLLSNCWSTDTQRQATGKSYVLRYLHYIVLQYVTLCYVMLRYIMICYMFYCFCCLPPLCCQTHTHKRSRNVR